MSGFPNYNNYSFLNGAGQLDFGIDNINSMYTQNANDPTVMQSIMGKLNGAGDTLAQNQSGISFGLGAMKSLADAWNAYSQNKLQKEALDFQKQQYATNLEMNKKSYNSSLSDRQERRVSANPNAESVASYMAKWGA